MLDKCPSCQCPTTVSTEEDTFKYGSDPTKAVPLQVTVDVGYCLHCDLAFTDDNAERRKEQAIAEYLRRNHLHEV